VTASRWSVGVSPSLSLTAAWNTLWCCAPFSRVLLLLLLLLLCGQALAFAVSKGSEEFLTKALEMCDAFDYDKPNVQQARRLLERIRRVKAEAALAVQYAVEDQIRTVVQAAREINTVSTDIVQLQNWLAIDREEFLAIMCVVCAATSWRCCVVALLLWHTAVECAFGAFGAFLLLLLSKWEPTIWQSLWRRGCSLYSLTICATVVAAG
jgi:hypothetical protein